jgi:DNA-binding transcriptional MocR family regulator
MSDARVAQVLGLSNPNLTRACQKLLIVLAHYENARTGLCCPGHEVLSRKLMVSKRQVIRLVKQSQKDGWLDVIPGQGRGHLSVYKLKLPPPEEPPIKGDISRNDAGGKGDFLSQTHSRKGDILGRAYKEVEQTRDKTEQESSARAFKPEMQSPFWCEAHGYAHSARLPNPPDGCYLEPTP